MDKIFKILDESEICMFKSKCWKKKTTICVKHAKKRTLNNSHSSRLNVVVTSFHNVNKFIGSCTLTHIL